MTAFSVALATALIMGVVLAVVLVIVVAVVQLVVLVTNVKRLGAEEKVFIKAQKPQLCCDGIRRVGLVCV